jgi:RHS repeat-associated protein
VTYKQEYNAENRISAIHKMDGDCTTGTSVESWSFVYDGDGVRTTTSHDTDSGNISITRYYFGGAYETRSDGTWKKYYSFAGQTVAMRDAEGFKYFLTDHLGSVSIVLDENGGILEQQRFLPFGQPRVMSPYLSVASTDYTYTGQRDLPDTGLMDYKARFYSPALGRFIQPDTIIPSAANPQSWNRYSYVTNNPLQYTDPTGHWEVETNDPVQEKLKTAKKHAQERVKKNKTKEGVGNGNRNNPDKYGGDVKIPPYNFNKDNPLVIPFDTDEMVANIPGTAEQWAQRAAIADEVALAYDLLLGVYVLTWVGVGFTVGLPFEGIVPVSGPAGAAAGYIVGEGSISQSGALWPGNIIAGYATYAGAIADAKSGKTSIEGQLSISPQEISLEAHGQVSSNTLISGALTSVGVAANIVTLSLPLQLAAVENDRGTFGSSSVPVNINVSFP